MLFGWNFPGVAASSRTAETSSTQRSSGFVEPDLSFLDPRRKLEVQTRTDYIYWTCPVPFTSPPINWISFQITCSIKDFTVIARVWFCLALHCLTVRANSSIVCLHSEKFAESLIPPSGWTVLRSKFASLATSTFIFIPTTRTWNSLVSGGHLDFL